VVDFFGHQREDVVDWLATVKWEKSLGVVKRSVVEETLGYVHVESRKTFGDGGIRVLEKAGVVKPLAGERDISMFVDTAVAQLV